MLLNFIKLKFIVKIFFTVICVLCGESDLDGKWYKVGTNWQIYVNFKTSNDGQILEQYIKLADNQNLIHSKKVYKNWLGRLYTNTEYRGKSYKSFIKLIDVQTIMYGNELYKKYDLPRDFLKGN